MHRHFPGASPQMGVRVIEATVAVRHKTLCGKAIGRLQVDTKAWLGFCEWKLAMSVAAPTRPCPRGMRAMA